MNKSRLRPISDKQKEKNKRWKAITDQKARDLNYICQWSGGLGHREDPESLSYLDGHHIVPRRYNIHTYDNCYLCLRKYHIFIEDNNIDVAIHKNKKEYEAYLISLWG